MESKLTIPALAAILADNTGRTKKSCEDFIKEFFRLTADMLSEGESVRIKGFGSFKTIDVEARASVDVSTGEPNEIKAHRKVVFTPAKEIADALNKPFDLFDTVEIDQDDELEHSIEEEVTPMEDNTAPDMALPELLTDFADAEIPDISSSESSDISEHISDPSENPPEVSVTTEYEIQEDGSVELAQSENIITENNITEEMRNPSDNRYGGPSDRYGSPSDNRYGRPNLRAGSLEEGYDDDITYEAYHDMSNERGAAPRGDVPPRPVDTPPQRPAYDPSMDRGYDRPGNRTYDRPSDSSYNRGSDASYDRSYAPPVYPGVYDRPADRGYDSGYPSSDTYNRPSDRPSYDRPSDRVGSDRISDRSAARPSRTSARPKKEVVYVKGKSRFGIGFLTGFVVATLICVIIFVIGCFFNWWPENLGKTKSSTTNTEKVAKNDSPVVNNYYEDSESDTFIDDSDDFSSMSSDSGKDSSSTPAASTSSSANSSGSKSTGAPVYDTVTSSRYLTTIAREHYGNPNLWPFIYVENQDKLGHPDKISPGTKVVVPPLSKYGVSAGKSAEQKAQELNRQIYAKYQ